MSCDPSILKMRFSVKHLTITYEVEELEFKTIMHHVYDLHINTYMYIQYMCIWNSPVV